jgi:alpha-1,6-mannosyltransferase
MKICDVTQFYSPTGGGVKRYIQEKRRYIERHTNDEHLLVIPGEKTSLTKEGRLSTATIKSPLVNETSRYRILFNLKAVEEIIRQENPDLIEAGDPYHVAWRVIDVGQILNIPTFGFYHSHFPEAYLRTTLKYCGSWLHDVGMAYAQNYIISLYNRFDVTLVPSQRLAALLETWGVFNTTTVHLGLDPEIFYPAPKNELLFEKLNLPKDKTLLLYVGRLASEKNTPMLLNTFRILDKLHPNSFSFLVIGDGQLRRNIEMAVQEIKRLRWLPRCKSEELADYYRLADLFVHPGICETFGLVSLESQACACPVIGIRGSCMDANIAEGLEFWASENDPDTLAQAILTFLKSDYRALGQKASGITRVQYAWTKVFENLWNCYRKAYESF